MANKGLVRMIFKHTCYRMSRTELNLQLSQDPKNCMSTYFRLRSTSQKNLFVLKVPKHKVNTWVVVKFTHIHFFPCSFPISNTSMLIDAFPTAAYANLNKTSSVPHIYFTMNVLNVSTLLFVSIYFAVLQSHSKWYATYCIINANVHTMKNPMIMH